MKKRIDVVLKSETHDTGVRLERLSGCFFTFFFMGGLGQFKVAFFVLSFFSLSFPKYTYTK